MSSTTTYALGAVALVLVVVVVILVMRWGRDEPSIRNDGYGPVRDPGVHAVLQPDGAILLGRPDARKTIDVFEDPLCPACGSLERIYGQEIAQKIDEGKLAVRYRFVDFLNKQSSSKDYSTRAIAANQCVAESGVGPAYSKFHDLLFTSKQPKEGGDDLNNADLATIAKDVGVPDQVVQCIATGAKVDSAGASAKTAMDDLNAALDGRAATPSVFDGATTGNEKKNEWVRLEVNNEEWVVVFAGPQTA